MQFLFPLVNDEQTLKRLEIPEKSLASFLKEGGFSGVELLKTEPLQPYIPRELIKGRHLYFYPIWYDFWQGRKKQLMAEFHHREAVISYYGTDDPQRFAQNIARDWADADEMGACYVVHHVSHTSLRESFTGVYELQDEEVASAFCTLIQAALGYYQPKARILLENQWVPGLTFLNPSILDYLIGILGSDRVGFVLDTGHLLNTAPDLATPQEALAYLQRRVASLTPYRNLIETVHLNYSLSGAYVRAARSSMPLTPKMGFWEKMEKALPHIGAIDRHEPFLVPGIQEVLEALDPKYVVFEISYRDRRDALNQWGRQKKLLGDLKDGEDAPGAS
ncbi:hypothetical protein ABB02_00303 [Clostridiaceae bacterium JG1575]|nr:hypothetical protein ABB02_00303 [Clostridiaceae bacterium JG1575]